MNLPSSSRSCPSTGYRHLPSYPADRDFDFGTTEKQDCTTSTGEKLWQLSLAIIRRGGFHLQGSIRQVVVAGAGRYWNHIIVEASTPDSTASILRRLYSYMMPHESFAIAKMVLKGMRHQDAAPQCTLSVTHLLLDVVDSLVWQS
jgi:hypothetical protein